MKVHLVIPQCADRFAVLFHVGDDTDFGKGPDVGHVGRMRDRVAQIPAEIDLLRLGQFLVPEH